MKDVHRDPMRVEDATEELEQPRVIRLELLGRLDLHINDEALAEVALPQNVVKDQTDCEWIKLIMFTTSPLQ